MAKLGLVAKACRKPWGTTDSKNDLPIAPNVLGRQFGAKDPNAAWLMDITCLKTTEGWLYLAVVMDLCSRMVVGWSIDRRMKEELVINALSMAIRIRNPSRGLICHSDRGSQYCSKAYQDFLDKHEFICSMSRKGNCFDNACVEAFFHTFKVGWIYGQPAKSRWVDDKCNWRIHRDRYSIGLLPPNDILMRSS